MRLFTEQATGLKDRLNKEKAANEELAQQCSNAEQSVRGMEDEVRLVKRQLAVMTKARDVARQEKEDWKATCNRSGFVLNLILGYQAVFCCAVCCDLHIEVCSSGQCKT